MRLGAVSDGLSAIDRAQVSVAWKQRVRDARRQPDVGLRALLNAAQEVVERGVHRSLRWVAL